jgi:hypothetical protein
MGLSKIGSNLGCFTQIDESGFQLAPIIIGGERKAGAGYSKTSRRQESERCMIRDSPLGCQC